MMEPRSPFKLLDYGQVQVQFLIAGLTKENMQFHLAQESERLRNLLQTRGHLGPPKKALVVVDGSAAPHQAPAAARKLQAEWLATHEDLLRLVTHSVAFVVPNPLVRFAVTAVLWVQPAPIPTSTHPTLEEALDWAIREARKLNVDVAPSLSEGGAEEVRAAIARERAGIGGP